MKHHFSPSQARALAAEFPIGDAFGGPAFGEKSFVGLAMGAASLVGGMMSADAAGDAASTQANAAQNAAGMSNQATMASIAEQRRQFDQTSSNMTPYMDTGRAALDKLSGMLGLNVSHTATPSFSDPATREYISQLRQRFPDLPDAWLPNQKDLQQFIDANPKYNGGGKTQSSMEDIMKMDPGYQFRLGQGTTALNNSAAAGGMQLSSNTMQSLMGYNQDYASGEYDKILSRLSGVAGSGQNAAGNLGSLGATTAASIGATGMSGANTAGNYLTQGANATAAGTVGSANALGTGLNNAYSNYMNQRLMSQLFTPSGNPNAVTSFQMGGPDGFGGMG